MVFALITVSLSGLAAVLLVHAVVLLLKGRLLPHVTKARCQLEIEADLIGITMSPLVLKLCAPLAAVIRMWFGFVRRRRLARIDDQLPDALALLGNALKAGLALSQAIEMASINLPPPIGVEFSRVAAQLKLGRTVEDAIAVMGERLPTTDVGLVVQSVEVLRRTGGNLVETFSTLAATIEARRRVESRVRVLTSQGLFQGMILLAMPWALGAALYLVAPEYLEPLISTRLGVVFIFIGVVLELTGGLWLKRIVMVKV